MINERLPHRLSVRTTKKKILSKLQHVYGKTTAHFGEDIVEKMKTLMDEDALKNYIYDYNSKCGLAKLYKRAGGQCTTEMEQAIELVS